MEKVCNHVFVIGENNLNWPRQHVFLISIFAKDIDYIKNLYTSELASKILNLSAFTHDCHLSVFDLDSGVILLTWYIFGPWMNVKVDGFKFNYVRIIILGLETSLMTYKVHVQNPWVVLEIYIPKEKHYV